MLRVLCGGFLACASTGIVDFSIIRLCCDFLARASIVDFSIIEYKDSLEEENFNGLASLVMAQRDLEMGIGIWLGEVGTCLGDPMNELPGESGRSGVFG